MSLPERKSVLVVDDDPDVRSIVRDNIQRISRHAVVQEASNGLEALLRAERQKFDLIITDLKMPKKDGIRLIEGLARLDKAFQPDRVIVLSGCFANPEYDLPAGVTRIQKPCTEEELRASILTAIPEGAIKKSPGQLFSDELTAVTTAASEALNSLRPVLIRSDKPTLAGPERLARGAVASFALGPGTLAETAWLEIERPWLEGLKDSLPQLTRDELLLEACSRIQRGAQAQLLKWGISVETSQPTAGTGALSTKPLIQITFESRLGRAWLLISLRTRHPEGRDAN